MSSRYVSDTKNMTVLTLEEAKKALENGINICYANSFPEYHGIHADEYHISYIQTEKELENIYHTFGMGIEHKAYLDPMYGDSPDLDILIKNNRLVKMEEKMLDKVAVIHEYEKLLGGENNPDTLTVYYEEVGTAVIKPEVYQAYDIEELVEVINEAYQDISIRRDIEKVGFRPTEELVEKIKSLNQESGRENTVKDIQQMYKKSDPYPEKVEELINEIAEECMEQELAVKATMQRNIASELSLEIEI